MFAPLPAPAEMSGWDRAAIDLGLPELLLMENASREALHVLSAETGHMPGKRVLLFMAAATTAGMPLVLPGICTTEAPRCLCCIPGLWGPTGA